MSQRNVEILLGKLLTDEGFRRSFFPVRASGDRAPDFGVAESRCLDLTPIERSALASLRRHRFDLMSQTIDPRISRSCGPAGAECPEAAGGIPAEPKSDNTRILETRLTAKEERS
jgi:hypothetical protein